MYEVTAGKANTHGQPSLLSGEKAHLIDTIKKPVCFPLWESNRQSVKGNDPDSVLLSLKNVKGTVPLTTIMPW